VPFLWIDDIYMASLVAKAVNAIFIQFKSLYTINDQLVYTLFTTSRSFYTAVFGHLVSFYRFSLCLFIYFMVISAKVNEHKAQTLATYTRHVHR